ELFKGRRVDAAFFIAQHSYIGAFNSPRATCIRSRRSVNSVFSISLTSTFDFQAGEVYSRGEAVSISLLAGRTKRPTRGRDKKPGLSLRISNATPIKPVSTSQFSSAALTNALVRGAGMVLVCFWIIDVASSWFIGEQTSKFLSPCCRRR